MAILEMKLQASSLMRTVPVTVILPLDKRQMPGRPAPASRLLRTLYLLHGMFGDQDDWIQYTNIRRYAEDHDLCVVMPSGENLYYVDRPDARLNFGRFIGEELVELTRRMFPLSHEREDTWIGGLSMGGYGALRNGLKYSETFGKICALSVANISAGLDKLTDDAFFPLQNRRYIETLLGDLSQVPNGDNSLEWLIRDRAKQGAALPEVYLACGLSDGFLNGVRDLRSLLEQNSCRLTYDETPGGHEWDFWDYHIRAFIEQNT